MEIINTRHIDSWFVRNYGPRCTLVCAVSILQKLGVLWDIEELVEIIEKETGFTENWGPALRAFFGKHCGLDRGIEYAAQKGGIRVRSKTVPVITLFAERWDEITANIKDGVPVILNCYRAPSGQKNHSVLAIGYQIIPRRLLTLDPNDGERRWLAWRRPWSGWVCTATFVESLESGKES